MSLREKIKEKKTPAAMEVKCPEWECSVFVKYMKASERAELSEQIRHYEKQGKSADAEIALVLSNVVDETGQQVFSPQDKTFLNDWGAVTGRLSAAILRFNKMDSEAVEEAKNESSPAQS